MKRIALVHWRPVEAAAGVEALRSLGFEVEYPGAEPQQLVKRLRASGPDAIVIDLTRLPSHGLAVGITLRQSKKTRLVPLVFAGGEPEKVKRVRQELPDATYAGWERMGAALSKALAKPVLAPVVPGSHLGAPAEKPLARKLGVKDGDRVGLFAAPVGFEGIFETCSGVEVAAGTPRGCRVVLVFAASQAELEFRAPRVAEALDAGSLLWVVYPKKAGPARSDLSMAAVREFLLEFGWVDYKVCSIDETWTGMCFGRRRSRVQ
ncbi:MAG: hypothetical protein SFV54_17010 [Bryobacteraceae bacterium]|nr:hypothetical protein [Bryobacteraceae bacterium]